MITFVALMDLVFWGLVALLVGLVAGSTLASYRPLSRPSVVAIALFSVGFAVAGRSCANREERTWGPHEPFRDSERPQPLAPGEGS